MLEGKFEGWFNNKQHEPNTLEKANTLSQSRFNKDFDELYTYEKSFIVSSLSRCE